MKPEKRLQGIQAFFALLGGQLISVIDHKILDPSLNQKIQSFKFDYIKPLSPFDLCRIRNGIPTNRAT